MLNTYLLKMVVLVIVSLFIFQGNVNAGEPQFEPLNDTEEFAPPSTGEMTSGTVSPVSPVNTTLNRLKIPFLIIILTLISGLIVRFKLNTTIRPLFLLGSVVFFGFYNGGCPFFITRENLFEQIDPFRIAFNMTSRYPFGWVLLGFLLLSSLFIYRPFCNGACPVGLVLGFIEKVPWAVAMRKNSNCIECGRCTVTCSSKAISKNEAVRQEVCIMCGDCMEACRENGIFPSTSKYEKPQAVFPTTTVSAGA